MPNDTPALSFFTRGTPVTKGSLRPFHRWQPNGHCTVGLREEHGERLKQWRGLIATDAARAMKNRMPFNEPVAVALTFYFDRPQSRAKETEAYAWGGKRWDVEKLVRGVFDAMTDAAVWTDDSNVAVVVAEKRWAEAHEPNGVRVTLKTTTSVRAGALEAVGT